MNLAQSLKPLKGFENMMNKMKKVALPYLPLFAIPKAVMAYEAPPGFESFSQVHEMNFV